MMTDDLADTLPLQEDEDEFDLDIQVIPSRSGRYLNWLGDPDPSQPGSTCHFSCQETCGGNCTFQADCSAE